MVDIDQPDRARGILSETDRRYLMDPESYKTRQTRHKRRTEIPERIRHAFLDMSILADAEFDGELLNDAFRDPGGDTVKMGEVVGAWRDRDAEVKERLVLDEDIIEAFIETIALIANVCHWTDYQGIIEEGTKTAVERFGDGYVVVDASYRPEIERPDDALKRARWKLEEDHRLTDEEAALLLKEEDVDPVAVAENIRDREDSEPGTDEGRTLADSIPTAQERGRELMEEEEEGASVEDDDENVEE